jgi:hypothetical protein
MRSGLEELGREKGRRRNRRDMGLGLVSLEVRWFGLRRTDIVQSNSEEVCVGMPCANEGSDLKKWQITNTGNS